MARGRPRRIDASIPTHIDQGKIPKGAYWDRIDRLWYTILHDPKARRRRIAGAAAYLSDLHRAMEELQGIDRNSLGWLLDQFHLSPTFAGLSERTRQDYEKQRKVAGRQTTKIGVLTTLHVARMTPPLVQRLLDRIVDEGHPTKANHLLRYLRRVFRWGMNRGHCRHNPAQGVEQAKERKQRRMPSEVVAMDVVTFARERGAYIFIGKVHAHLICGS